MAARHAQVAHQQPSPSHPTVAHQQPSHAAAFAACHAAYQQPIQSAAVARRHAHTAHQQPSPSHPTAVDAPIHAAASASHNDSEHQPCHAHAVGAGRVAYHLLIPASRLHLRQV